MFLGNLVSTVLKVSYHRLTDYSNGFTEQLKQWLGAPGLTGPLDMRCCDPRHSVPQIGLETRRRLFTPRKMFFAFRSVYTRGVRTGRVIRRDLRPGRLDDAGRRAPRQGTVAVPSRGRPLARI